jgi:hypothetical protein
MLRLAHGGDKRETRDDERVGGWRRARARSLQPARATDTFSFHDGHGINRAGAYTSGAPVTFAYAQLTGTDLPQGTGVMWVFALPRVCTRWSSTTLLHTRFPCIF